LATKKHKKHEKGKASELIWLRKSAEDSKGKGFWPQMADFTDEERNGEFFIRKAGGQEGICNNEF
jgi:hypothetical protein